MKNIIYLLLLLVLFSCKSLTPPTPIRYASHVDYSYFTNKGIFVTESNSVNFEYETLGSLYVECTGGWVKKNKSNEIDMEDVYMNKMGNYLYAPARVEEAFDLAMVEVIKLQGNGIINLKITPGTYYYANYLTGVNKITITGMIIKK